MPRFIVLVGFFRRGVGDAGTIDAMFHRRACTGASARWMCVDPVILQGSIGVLCTKDTLFQRLLDGYCSRKPTVGASLKPRSGRGHTCEL
jgi:hypothetical protein